ncbi:MAG: hypothetical protein K5912_02100 [Alphaproteobacteria bacterium]|nr:hypothetical protein [Alphaproteobacteria bacterium]
MASVITFLEKSVNVSDIFKMTYGISSEEHFDCVFVAPSWNVEKVFTQPGPKIELLYEGRDITAYEIKNGGKRYLYALLRIGAPNIIDFCLSCYKLNCDNFVFLGSVGALVSDVNLGDIVVPTCSISGEGASLYLFDKLDAANMFKRAYSNRDLNKKLRDICVAQNIKCVDATPVSVDSVFCEYAHVSEFKELGANVIEMETSAFFNAMNYIHKKASALLVVSDNSSVGQHLMDENCETRNRYHKAREVIQKILLNL